jgi:hypothetical protein
MSANCIEEDSVGPNTRRLSYETGVEREDRHIFNISI